MEPNQPPPQGAIPPPPPPPPPGQQMAPPPTPSQAQQVVAQPQPITPPQPQAPPAAYQQQAPPQYAAQPQPPMQPPPSPEAAAQQRELAERGKVNPNSTQSTLQVAEIRDGIAIMADGSYRAVVMTKSINFDLMSPQEREAVEFSYQGFLNSLYFPIQIYMRSSKVDIRPYLEKLNRMRSQQDNMLLGILMEDYIQYIALLAQETNIMDKKFYIIIPYFKSADAQVVRTEGKGLLNSIFGKQHAKVHINEADLEEAKSELKNRVQAVLNGLMQFGVQGLPLDTQELIELFYDAYNPDTATRQQIRSTTDINAPIITKGAGSAPQPNLDREML